MTNMAFATTIVTNGHAKAVAVATGMETKVGAIAKIIADGESPQTPIQRKLEEVRQELRYGLPYNLWAHIFNWCF